MSTENDTVLWVQRPNGRFTSSLVLRHQLREARLGAFLDESRQTVSHFAVIIGRAAYRTQVLELLAENQWEVTDEYEPTDRETQERDTRNQRRSRVIRGITTLTGPLIDEKFGPTGRRWHY